MQKYEMEEVLQRTTATFSEKKDKNKDLGTFMTL